MIALGGVILSVVALFGMMIRRTWISLLLGLNALFSGLAAIAAGVGISTGHQAEAQLLGGVIILFGNLVLIVGLALSVRLNTRSNEKTPAGTELEKLTELRN